VKKAFKFLNLLRSPFALSALIGLVLLVSLLLAGNQYLKQGFNEQVKASAIVTTKGVKGLITEKFEQYDLISRSIVNHHKDRIFELAAGAGYPYDLNLISNEIKDLFSEIRQFAILDDIGQVQVGSEGYFLGDLCRVHINASILNPRTDLSGEIHQCERGAHYDVVINLNRGEQQASLYLSFYLVYLQELLLQFSGNELSLIMVKGDDLSQVMLTTLAIAANEPLEILSPREINQIMANVQISEGGWRIVALPTSGLFEAYNSKIDRASWALLAGILILYFIFIYYLRLANQARFKAEQKASYSALFNAGPTVLIEKDLRLGESLEYVSPNVSQVLGFTSETILRDYSLNDLIQSEDQARFNSALTLAIESKQQTLEIEFRLIRANRQYIWVYGLMHIKYDQKGNAQTLQGYLTSINAQKLAENQATSLISNAPDAILVTDTKGRIQQANKRVEEIFGYKSQDLIGLPISLLLPDFDEGFQALDRLLESEQEEIEGYTSEGESIILGLRLNQMILKSSKVYAIVLRDITQQKLAQKQLQQAKEHAEQLAVSRTRFMAMVSHEIRTPMNGVLGMADLLANTPLNKQQSDYLEVIQQSGDSLVTILNDVLDFSKIDQGSMTLRSANFELRQVLDSCFNLLKPQASLGRVTLDKRYSLNCPATLYGDAMRLRQIVINLLGNAIKFSPKGRVELLVDVQKNEGKSVLLSLVFKDNGLGISEAEQHVLFDPFTQSDNGLSRSFGGTGLGLSISKKLTELMDGEIKVVSTLGVGSVFSVELPFQSVDAAINIETPTHLTSRAEPPFLIKPNQRVLLVEDDAVNQKIAASFLENLGVQVDVVNNGVEAIEFWQMHHQNIDLILMDCQMPIMDGYEATRMIRHEETLMEVKQPVVIIAFTADGYEENVTQSKEAGMDDIMVKPIHLVSFNDKVQSWLNRDA